MIDKVLSFISGFFKKERQRSPRYSPSRVIKCDCSYMESGEKIEFLAEISNVSKSGILLMTYQQRVYPETWLEISFKLPSSKEALSIHGVVVRSYRVTGLLWHYIAIRLEDQNEEGVRILVEACQ